MITLDVGCGQFPQGTVNCDLYVDESEHRSGIPIDPKAIPNFVRCEIHFLPFKNEAVDKVVCSHVLEHKGIKPLKVLKELLRVLKIDGVIEVVVPHRFARLKWLRYSQHNMHARYFNATSLTQLLRKVGITQMRGTITYRYFPHSFFPFIRLPWIVKMKGWKRNNGHVME